MTVAYSYSTTPPTSLRTATQTGVWTALPPLPLIGIGTAQVESLDHYLIRLADLVGITHDRMLEICSAAAGHAVFPPHGTSSPFLCNETELEARIAAMEQLTGQNDLLRHGTPWACSAVMGVRAFSRTARFRRWCPVCYLQWDPDRSAEPLGWSIEIKKVCSLHGCELVDRCQSCGKAQPARTRYRARRACRFCRTPLGWHAEPVSAHMTPLDRWVESQVDQVIELCSDPAQEKLPADRFHLFLEAFSVMHGDRADLPPALRSVVSLWSYAPATKISLKMLVNLAGMHGCSVLDILLDPVRTAQREPFFGFWQGFDYLPLTPRSRLRGSVRLQVALRNLLRRAAVCYLPSLALVADHAGCKQPEILHVQNQVLAAYRQARRVQHGKHKSKLFEQAIQPALDALGLIQIKRVMLYKIVPEIVTASRLDKTDARRIAETALILRRAKRAHDASLAVLPDTARDTVWLQ
ncbi:MAG: TniQ family protein [Vulcanimicrobiaceae bacterium]